MTMKRAMSVALVPLVLPAGAVSAQWRTHVVALTSDGELLVFRRSPERFEEVRRYEVAQTPTWAHPIVIGSRIVVRDADSVALWSLKK